MDFVTNEKLKEWNLKGLIPGPLEKKEEFIFRVNNVMKKREDETAKSLEVQKIFDVSPSWVKVIYSNEGIGLWEGACTWIWENEVYIQLRKKLERRPNIFWGLYKKTELLAHELVHAVRMKFQDSEFEELLAYQTSNSFFRRFLGPLFRSSKEVYILFICIASGGMVLMFSKAGFFISLGYLSFLICRLFNSWILFKKAYKKIYTLTGIYPLWIMVRLADKEIRLFAKSSSEEILSYIKKKRINDWRWRQIYNAYFM